MARKEVTFDEVAAAAADLLNQGKEVTVATLRDVLDTGSASALHNHFVTWRAGQAEPVAEPVAVVPDAIVAALGNWAQQFAEEAGAGTRAELAQAEADMAVLLDLGEQLETEREELLAQVDTLAVARDEAMVSLAERDEEITRLTVELRNARQVATEALVGKAKDQLAIEGKDAQLKDLRAQLERNLAATAAESDARLAVQMELAGAVTARDNFAAEINDLRARLEASTAERSALRVEIQGLRRQGAGQG